MQLEQQLTDLGLTLKDAKIYLAALELGPCTILQLSKQSGIKRSTIYEVIEDLKRQKLIYPTIRGTKKLFTAAEPEKIVELLGQRQMIAKMMLPQLQAINAEVKVKPKIRYFEGIDGMKEVYETLLTSSTELRAFVSIKALDELEDYLLNSFTKRRVEKNIRAKSIAPDLPWFKKTYSANQEKLLREVRLVPAEKYPFEIETVIFDNKVAIFSFDHKTAMLIESIDIYNTWRMIFDLTWESRK